YYVAQDTDPDVIGSTLVEDLPEQNMGDATTLVDFVEWAMAHYPAEHYLLILSDHGNGWEGVIYDNTNAGHLGIPELGSALTTVETDMGRGLDIVAFDACLMGMAEVAYEVRNSADIMTGSEEVMRSSHWPYAEVLSQLVASPDTTPSALASVIVQNSDFPDEDSTQSAVALASMPTVATALDDFAAQLIAGHDTYSNEIRTVWTDVERYYRMANMDLYDFAQRIQTAIPDAGIQSAAQTLMDAIDDAVLDEFHDGRFVSGSHGLSIYYPNPDDFAGSYDSLALAQNTQWDEFVQLALPALPDDHGDAAASATPLQIGEWTDGLLETQGDADWFAFPGIEGDLYDIEVDISEGTLYDSYLRLYDSTTATNGTTPIGEDDDSGWARGSLIQAWQAPQTTTYYFSARAFDDLHIGSYRVRVTYMDTTGPRVASVSPEVVSPFVSTDGTEFVANGGPFYVAGANSYYLMAYAADPDTRPYVDEVIEDAANMGLNVLRTWAFNDGNGWNALQTAPGAYDETVFEGLDYVIHKAGDSGIRVLLPFVNYWEEYGGMDQYVAWDSLYGDGSATERSDFYTDPDIRQWYKDYVHTVLNRVNTYTGIAYKDDPTIFAWELANEPRAEGDLSGNILQGWIEEMAAYVKSIDPKHMVTTGVEGFYDEDSG
ncbi:MAG TPA: hypothetical protein EYP14_20190, partial [Planctomycetaceae bacterium]|nr:hypothetical protein [Planctomycetaceae bacterium]